MKVSQPHRYDQCGDDCTVDCGHCKVKPIPRWFSVAAVLLPTGLKSYPNAWAMRGDTVRVSDHRGKWKILAISRLDGTTQVNVDLLAKSHTRCFRSTQLTLSKHTHDLHSTRL